jgi:hypothetical protein
MEGKQKLCQHRFFWGQFGASSANVVMARFCTLCAADEENLERHPDSFAPALGYSLVDGVNDS